MTETRILAGVHDRCTDKAKWFLHMGGGHWGVAKTAKPQQNVPKTAKPCPKSLKTETAMSV